MARNTARRRSEKADALLAGTAPPICTAEDEALWDAAFDRLRELAAFCIAHPWLMAVEPGEREAARQAVRKTARELPVRVCLAELRQINNASKSLSIRKNADQGATTGDHQGLAGHVGDAVERTPDSD